MKLPLWKSKSHEPRSRSSLWPYLKRKRILFTFILVGFLLVGSAWLSFDDLNESGFLAYYQNVEVIPYADGLHVFVNEQSLDHVIQAEKCQRLSTSIDGNVAAFLTENKELYLVHERRLEKLADNVLHFELSASGQGLAFAQKFTKRTSLTLYDLDEETQREITASLTRLDFSLSPDGKSLAYYTQPEDQEVLMCYQEEESKEISAENVDLVGLSDDAENIYAVRTNKSGGSVLYSYNQRGKATKLGSVTSISFKFNHDHEEIMFYNDGKTLISTNGRKAVTASSYPLYLVTSPNSQSASDGNAITLPITSFFDHVYTCSDGESTSAWLIREDPEDSEKLVSRVSGCALDASAQYLYFIQDQTKLCAMDISDGLSKIYTLAENADNYAVTSERSKVYYIDNGDLYCTNGKIGGDSCLIATNISSFNLVMSASDTLYYLSDHKAYSCTDGITIDCVLDNIRNIYNSSNNVVYIIGENEIYTAHTTEQPIKVFKLN